MSWNVVDKYGFDPDGSGDNAGKFLALHSDLADYEARKKPMPNVVFPEGRYSYSSAPNFALHNLNLTGDGQVEFCYTGSGDAFTFDGDANGPSGGGKFNMTISNIRFVPTTSAQDTLVIKSIHHSVFDRVRAYGAGQRTPSGMRHAIYMAGCVLDQLHNCTVTNFDAAWSEGGGSYDCVGLYLDKTRENNWQVTDCQFVNPIIEQVTVGVHLFDGGGCQFIGGSVEYCPDIGIYMETGGQNRIVGTWLEGNNNWDIKFGRQAHDNRFDVAHPSNLRISRAGQNNKVISTTDR